MADEGTARKLVLAGAIIQFLFVVYYAYLIFTVPGLVATIIIDPSLAWMLPMITMIIQVMYGIFAVLGIIFAIIWLVWWRNPMDHRMGLIASGALGLLFAGLIPGLLVLIGGIVTPKDTIEYGEE